MKRLGVMIAVVASLGLAVLGIGIAKAASSTAEVSDNQTINGVYVRAADSVSVRGTVNGDVVVAGSTVEIDGTVNGSVYVGAEKVTIRGTVAGNIHAAGSEVEISAQDTGSVFVAGSNVRMSDDLRARNVFAGGSDVAVRGEIGQNMYVGGSTILIASKIGGDVAAAGESITVAGATTIGGNFTYTSQSEATIENDRSIAGSIKRANPSEQVSAQDRILAQLSDLAYWLAANILIAAVLLFFMPKVFMPAEAVFVKKPLNNYFKALAFVIFTPIALVLMLFTIVGIPLAFMAGLVYILVLVLAPTASAHFVGSLVLDQLQKDKKKSLGKNYAREFTAAATGFFVLAVVGLVPVLGGLVTLTAFFLGVAILLSRNLAPLGYGEASKK